MSDGKTSAGYLPVTPPLFVSSGGLPGPRLKWRLSRRQSPQSGELIHGQFDVIGGEIRATRNWKKVGTARSLEKCWKARESSRGRPAAALSSPKPDIDNLVKLIFARGFRRNPITFFFFWRAIRRINHGTKVYELGLKAQKVGSVEDVRFKRNGTGRCPAWFWPFLLSRNIRTWHSFFMLSFQISTVHMWEDSINKILLLRTYKNK